MIFVNSMSDLFTKRPSRARRFWEKNWDLFDGNEIPDHIWMGTSVEDRLGSAFSGIGAPLSAFRSSSSRSVDPRRRRGTPARRGRGTSAHPRRLAYSMPQVVRRYATYLAYQRRYGEAEAERAQ